MLIGLVEERKESRNEWLESVRKNPMLLLLPAPSPDPKLDCCCDDGRYDAGRLVADLGEKERIDEVTTLSDCCCICNGGAI